MYATPAISLQRAAAYWRWYAKLNFLSYSWKALMINQFEHESVGIYDNVEVCCTHINPDTHRMHSTQTLAKVEEIRAACAITMCADVQTLTFYGLHGEHAWSQIGIEVSFFAAFLGIALLGLHWSKL